MSQSPNILMICVDDLRPLLGCHGHAEMHTPHIDRLAAGGVRCDKAYCQVPVCGASRASILTGLLPTRERFTTFYSRADEDSPHAPTFPGVCHDAGWRTAGSSKIFHDAKDHSEVWDDFLQLPRRFSHPDPYYSPRALDIVARARAERPPDVPAYVKSGPAWDCADVPDDAHHDGITTDWATAQLEAFARDRARPFLLGYGSTNVHLPFRAPQRYWDLYDRDALPLPDHAHQPADVPPAALHPWGELRNYSDMPATGPLDDDTARTLIHGYRAGVSYLDAQIGRLLDTLDRTGLAADTIVILWVDHGFNLGEHGLWCKHSLFETSLHVPLILRGPGIPAGKVIPEPIGNLSIFPTLCELAGLPTPAGLAGKSLVARFDGVAEPARVFSRFGNGESIRTDRHRYSQWTDEAGQVYARTLFDLTDAPGEHHNLAHDPAREPLMQELATSLLSP